MAVPGHYVRGVVRPSARGGADARGGRVVLGDSGARGGARSLMLVGLMRPALPPELRRRVGGPNSKHTGLQDSSIVVLRRSRGRGGGDRRGTDAAEKDRMPCAAARGGAERTCRRRLRVRPPIPRSDAPVRSGAPLRFTAPLRTTAPLRRDQQELLAALAASIRVPDHPRVVGENTPECQEICAAALRADALARFVGGGGVALDMARRPLSSQWASSCLKV